MSREPITPDLAGQLADIVLERGLPRASPPANGKPAKVPPRRAKGQ